MSPTAFWMRIVSPMRAQYVGVRSTAAKRHAPLRRKLLAYALSLPEAEVHHPWGENVAKVGGKIFFFGGRPDNDFLAGLKLPVSRTAALRLPGAEPMPPALSITRLIWLFIVTTHHFFTAQ